MSKNDSVRFFKDVIKIIHQLALPTELCDLIGLFFFEDYFINLRNTTRAYYTEIIKGSRHMFFPQTEDNDEAESITAYYLQAAAFKEIENFYKNYYIQIDAFKEITNDFKYLEKTKAFQKCCNSKGLKRFIDE